MPAHYFDFEVTRFLHRSLFVMVVLDCYPCCMFECLREPTQGEINAVKFLLANVWGPWLWRRGCCLSWLAFGGASGGRRSGFVIPLILSGCGSEGKQGREFYARCLAGLGYLSRPLKHRSDYKSRRNVLSTAIPALLLCLWISATREISTLTDHHFLLKFIITFLAKPLISKAYL